VFALIDTKVLLQAMRFLCSSRTDRAKWESYFPRDGHFKTLPSF
jgi:hypothetical protein